MVLLIYYYCVSIIVSNKPNSGGGVSSQLGQSNRLRFCVKLFENLRIIYEHHTSEFTSSCARAETYVGVSGFSLTARSSGLTEVIYTGSRCVVVGSLPPF